MDSSMRREAKMLGKIAGTNEERKVGKSALDSVSEKLDIEELDDLVGLGQEKRKFENLNRQEKESGGSEAESEEDYMSAAFLDSMGKDEIGAISYKKRRIKQLNESMLKGQTKSKDVLLKEEWDHSQNKKITPQNKGFQMLLRMGYKEGHSIGKKTEQGAAIDPIAVTLKNDKLGLGKSSKTSNSFLSIAQKKAIDESLEKKKIRFRNAMIDKRYSQLLEKDVEQARHICMDLDEKKGKKQSPFWPRTNPIPTIHLDPGISSKSDVNFEQEEFNLLCTEDKINVLTAYLRSQYFYCQWCSVEYNDEEDMERNCPGDDRRDHDGD